MKKPSVLHLWSKFCFKNRQTLTSNYLLSYFLTLGKKNLDSRGACHLALLKAQVSLRGKFSVQIMDSQFLKCTHTCTEFYSSQTAKRKISAAVLSVNMYECFMNTKYLCACLKRYHANLSLKQGYRSL